MAERRSVRQRLAAGERCYGTMVFELFTPGITAILDQLGYDFVIMDTEHSGVGIETLKAQIAYGRGLGIEVHVRAPDSNYSSIATVMDAGAQGVMVPMVETPEQARAIVDAVRYRPAGRRGLAFGVAHDAYGARPPSETIAAANADNLAMCLIESRRGIENAEAILATPGVDVGWLGHFDLSDSLGCTAQFDHPDFDAALDGFVAACAATGTAAGILDPNPAMLDRMARLGFRALGYGPDVAALKAGFGRGMETLRGLPKSD